MKNEIKLEGKLSKKRTVQIEKNRHETLNRADEKLIIFGLKIIFPFNN